MKFVGQQKPSSRILEAVHETAADLHKLSLIDSHRMQHYDAVCQQFGPAPGEAKAKAVTNCDHL